MCTGNWAGKHGQKWSTDDRDEALLEIARAQLDKFIRFTFLKVRWAFKDEGGDEQALELAKDIVSTKLAEAWLHRLHTYDPTRHTGQKCPFCNWLYVMIARAAGKAAEREVKRQVRLRTFQKETERQQPPRESCIPPRSEQTQEASDILWELAQPHRDRFRPTSWEAMALYWGKGLTYDQAAQEADCSRGAMEVRLHRARHELHAIMQTCCTTDTEEGCHEPRSANTSHGRRNAVLHA